MKKLISIALCAAMAMSMSAINVNAAEKQTYGAESEYVTGIANPYEECNTLEDAELLSGITFNIPQISDIDGAASMTIRASSSLKMICISYDDKNGNEIAEIRKAYGNDDISGDWRDFDKTSSITVNDTKIKLSKIDGGICSAVWTSGNYSYSVFAPEDNPVSVYELSSIAEIMLTEKNDDIVGDDPSSWCPYTEYQTMDEAEEAADFSLSVTKLPKGYTRESICVYDVGEYDDDTMIQLTYTNGEKEITIRKAPGSKDISGDYNNYDRTYKSNGAVYKGSSRSKINNATWTKNGYTYSITVLCR